MGKLHELLAVEQMTTAASERLLAETKDKFHKFSEFFTGTVRTLARIKDSPEDKAAEAAARRDKQLPTNVPDTLQYIFPHIAKTLNLKLSKHATDQVSKADIVLDGEVLMKDVPVDFLLELEKILPEWRNLFQSMPTLDPSKKWVAESKNVWKLAEPVQSAQTEKQFYPVVLAEATTEHPAQVKEASRDVIVGTFSDMLISGAATTDQKAAVLTLLDKLIAAVKQARMRANSVDIVETKDADKLLALVAKVFE